MAKGVKKYSIDDLNRLINSIKEATGLIDEKISLKAGKNAGYISQVRSRGDVPDSFYELLELKFKEDLENPKSGKVYYKDVYDPGIYKEKYIRLLEQQNDVNWRDALEILKANQSLLNALAGKLLETDKTVTVVYKKGEKKDK